jgi:hypothetical protein
VKEDKKGRTGKSEEEDAVNIVDDELIGIDISPKFNYILHRLFSFIFIFHCTRVFFGIFIRILSSHQIPNDTQNRTCFQSSKPCNKTTEYFISKLKTDGEEAKIIDDEKQYDPYHRVFAVFYLNETNINPNY